MAWSSGLVGRFDTEIVKLEAPKRLKSSDSCSLSSAVLVT